MEQINCAYIRLSEEDVKKDINEYSESITNQIILIEEFAKKNKIQIHKKYIDDGFSGINFARPAFKEMLEDISNKNISTIITKDFSRLGREYIETSYYITRYFPENNIRYIAINENYDSSKKDNDLNEIIVGIKGIINDKYIKETSKKITEVKKQKTEKGYYLGFIAPYGYKKVRNLDGKITIIPDEKVCNIVKRIFEEIAKGKSKKALAQELNEEKISSPMQYLKLAKSKGKNYYDKWTEGIIYRIIRNQIYIGNTYKRKSIKQDYRQKKREFISEKNREIIENMHLPIISKELFEKANKQIGRNAQKLSRVKNCNCNFIGIAKCGECGSNLKISGRKRESSNITFSLYCSNGKNPNKECTNTRTISVKKLEDIIYSKLLQIAKENLEDDKIIDASSKYVLNNKKYIKKIENFEKEIEYAKKEIKEMYLEKVNKNITEEKFKEKRDKINKQILLIEGEKERLKKELEYEIVKTNMIQEFKKFKEKDNLMNYINELVNEIIFYENRRIKIKFKFTN